MEVRDEWEELEACSGKAMLKLTTLQEFFDFMTPRTT